MRTTLSAMAGMMLFWIAMEALADVPAPATKTVQLVIERQVLADALNDWAHQTGFQVVSPTSEMMNRVVSPQVKGELSAEEALERLLAGTELTHVWINERAVAVKEVNESKGTVTGMDASALQGHGEKRLRVAQAGAEAAASSSDGEKRDGGASQDETGATLEEIVVTAQKKEERLQDVPFGISALTAQDLERTGAMGYRDVFAQVPGVQFMGASRGRNAIIIRGVATRADNGDNQQPTVEQFLDDMPLTDRFGPWGGTDLGTFDIERVEVLRGPQGTLFGSGAMGGAVRLITSKPDLSAFRAKLEAGLSSTRGGDDSTNIAGMLNAPLVQDKLALRAVAYRRRDGGWVENVFREQDNVNRETQEGGRLMFAYQPTEALKLGFTALHDEYLADDSPLTFRFNDNGGGAPDNWQGIDPERTDSKLDLYSATVDYDFGPASLASVTSYGERDMFLTTDWARVFGVTSGDFDFFITRDSKRFAQEVRLSSHGETPFEWVVGGFFFDYSLATHQVWRLPGPFTLLNNDELVEVTESALFGEATYHLTDKLSVTAGVRAFRNKYGHTTTSAADAGGIDSTSPLTEAESDAVTPKLSMSFYPRDDVHLYATAAKGYRVGQINFNLGLDPRIPRAYDPDSLWNYEIGMKSTWLDGRLKANLAGYYIDWKDIQLTLFLFDENGNGILASNHINNAGQAEIKGVEAELAVVPVEGIELGTAMTYNDGELTSVDEGVNVGGITVEPGTPLPGTPKFSASGYLQGSRNFGPAVAGYLRLAYRHVGTIPVDLGNPDSLPVESYDSLDLRLGAFYQNYELALSVENLRNDDAITSGSGFTFDQAPSATRLRPRTIGITLRASF
jgi:iron complex outermembrane recepter protein